MKNLLVLVLVLSVSSFFWGCPGKKSKANAPTNPVINTYNNPAIVGDGINFYNDYGTLIGRDVDVNPKELVLLLFKFQPAFLQTIISAQGGLTNMGLELYMDSASGSPTLTYNMTSYADSNSYYYVPEDFIDAILTNGGPRQYYMRACAGGFGSTRCSSYNGIHFKGETGSTLLGSIPSVTQNNGCTYMEFISNTIKPQNIYPGDSRGILQGAMLHRASASPSILDVAILYQCYSVNYYTCTTWQYYLQPTEWGTYTSGDITLQIRDSNGFLSPAVTVHCN